MYDSYTGRFMEEDPLGFDAGDMNLYRYVKNDPTNATDPSGLFGVPNVELLLRPLTANGETNQQMLGNPAEMCLPLEAMVTDFVPAPSLTTQQWNRPPQNTPPEQELQLQLDVESLDLSQANQIPRQQLANNLRQFYGEVLTDIERERLSEDFVPYYPPSDRLPLTRPVTRPERIQPMCIVPLVRLGDNPNWRDDPRAGIWLALGATDDTLVPSILPSFGGCTAPAMAAVRPPNFSARWRARAVTDPACQTGCENAARQIQGHVGGDIITIRPIDPRATLGAYRGHVAGERGWYTHQVVVRNGRVYDAFTGHEGLPIAEYKALWQHADAINFGF